MYVPYIHRSMYVKSLIMFLNTQIYVYIPAIKECVIVASINLDGFFKRKKNIDAIYIT